LWLHNIGCENRMRRFSFQGSGRGSGRVAHQGVEVFSAKKDFFLSILFVLILGAQPAMAQQEGRIALIVNGEAITTPQIDARIKLGLLSAGGAATPAQIEALRPQAIDALIDESLRLQEARRAGITVSDEEIEAGIAQIASNNNLQAQQLLQILRRANVPSYTLYDQVAAMLAWRKFMQERIAPQTTILDQEIATRRQQYIDSVGEEELLLSEIFLPIVAPDRRDEAVLAGEELHRLLENGAPFAALAQQYSQAPSAENQGDRGWTQSEALSPQSWERLKSLEIGQYSAPLIDADAVRLFLLRDRRLVSEDGVPSRAEVRDEILREKVNQRQEELFRELRNRAFIDDRTDAL